jgi:beta-lactamase class D
MKYGNEQIGPELTTFWLEGDLKISAAEQITFLKKLYTREYPFKSSSYEALRNLMVIDRTPAYTIRAKTGWSQTVGWIVGYVESGEKVWFFATNMDIAKLEDCHFRREIALEALRLKGII